MSYRTTLMFVAAAALTSAALIIPSASLAAQRGHTVNYNNMPMIEGSGRVVRQNRSVGAFRRVETLGSEVVEVRLGARPSLVIAADDNILRLISSEVKNGTLKIESRGSYRTRSPIRVWITTPDLEAFSTMGSGNVTIHGVDNRQLSLAIHGSGDMQATGRTRQLDVSIYGSGNARLGGLTAADVNAALYGSGSATVRASGELDAQVVGSGTLRYLGQPASVRRQRIGSGRIIAGR